MTLPTGARNVIVIGGGLAGMSAAVELAEAGLRVTILESRPWLGGATFSFARRGLTIDNGQHMFLRCCTAYRDLLAKLGVAGSAPVQEALNLTVIGPDCQVALRRSGLPAPLHLARSLAGYRHLSVPERVKVAVAMVALQFTEFRGDEGSFEDWLDRRFQPLPARRLFWDLLATTGLNLAGGQADLGLTADAIRMATLSGRDSADIGLPAVPLSRLHGGAATGFLTQHGAEIRLGARALSVQADPAGGYLVRFGAEAPAPAAGQAQLTADAVVLAVPAWEAAELAPAGLAADAARWAALEPSPMVSMHVMYGSRVTRLPFAAIVGRQVLWVADKTVPAGLHAGQYLAVSVPAADDYVNASTASLREQFLALLARYFPAAATATVEDFFVTRERRATIRQLPGRPHLRPGQPQGVPGFALAGAWTDTGWPDTMEGAVRSGLAAAGKVIAELAAGRMTSVTLSEPPRTGAAVRAVSAARASAADLGAAPPGPLPPGLVPAGSAVAAASAVPAIPVPSGSVPSPAAPPSVVLAAVVKASAVTLACGSDGAAAPGAAKPPVARPAVRDAAVKAAAAGDGADAGTAGGETARDGTARDGTAHDASAHDDTGAEVMAADRTPAAGPAAATPDDIPASTPEPGDEASHERAGSGPGAAGPEAGKPAGEPAARKPGGDEPETAEPGKAEPGPGAPPASRTGPGQAPPRQPKPRQPRSGESRAASARRT
jgi:squalene-associated FAD-dependent desaturase